MKVNKFLIGIFAVAMITIAGVNVSLNAGHDGISSVKLANIKALSQESNILRGTKKTVTQVVSYKSYETTESGWKFQVGANVWLFNGSVSHTPPSSYYEITITRTETFDCCQLYDHPQIPLCVNNPCE
jgi:phage terminase large subunit-like protein